MQPSGISACFPFAGSYAPASAHGAWMAREAGDRGRRFAYTERHVQAVWYDPQWRPSVLMSSQGERIEVESPGRWNIEAGPDFIGATLRVGPDLRRITGDVEVHVFPSDWLHHGHADDPRYRQVCLHLTYFDGALADSALPPGALQAALQPALKVMPGFAFEHIDVSAYPYGGRADVPPCRRVLAEWPIAQRERLLEAAGHERMRRKAERFAEAIRERGQEQALYEACLVALGYQHNKRPFQELAARLPLERLRAAAHGDVERAYALLAGVSGLLPSDIHAGWDDETRRQVRVWWDIWWKERHRMPAPMAASGWRRHGIRPLNHPLRRLATAAVIGSTLNDAGQWLSAWLDGSPGGLLERVGATLQARGMPYWEHRGSLGGVRHENAQALVGAERLDIIALNVVVPFAAAAGREPADVRSVMSCLKPEKMNQVMREAAFYLFGPDAPASLCRGSLRRQGLIQIFQDYCLHDRSWCGQCAFPGALAELSRVWPAGR